MAQAVLQFSVAQASPLSRPMGLGLQAPTTSPGCCLCLDILFRLHCKGRPGLSGKCFSAELSPVHPGVALLISCWFHCFGSWGRNRGRGRSNCPPVFCPSSEPPCDTTARILGLECEKSHSRREVTCLGSPSWRLA